MTDLAQAIKGINGDAKFIIKNEDIDNIQWIATTPISKEDILAKQNEMTQAEADAKAKKATDKASAKAKLIAGEALTEAEADTIVI